MLIVLLKLFEMYLNTGETYKLPINLN